MKLAIFLLFVFLVEFNLANVQVWLQWKRAFRKTYTTEGAGPDDPDAKYEEEKRYKIFTKNLADINDHNLRYVKNEVTYKLSLNEFSDLSHTELFRRFSVKMDADEILAEAANREKFVRYSSARIPLPKYFNWAELNYLSKPRHQEDCGACWAFASVTSFSISIKLLGLIKYFQNIFRLLLLNKPMLLNMKCYLKDFQFNKF